MLWTDYWRIREQLDLVQDSVNRLRKLLKYGKKEAVEMEASFLNFNYQILLHIKKNYMDVFFDVRIIRLEKEVEEIMQRTGSLP